MVRVHFNHIQETVVFDYIGVFNASILATTSAQMLSVFRLNQFFVVVSMDLKCRCLTQIFHFHHSICLSYIFRMTILLNTIVLCIPGRCLSTNRAEKNGTWDWIYSNIWIDQFCMVSIIRLVFCVHEPFSCCVH